MKNNFSENFLKLRLSQNLSKRELSQKTGVSEMAIGYYERGERNPTLENLIKISDFFNVPIDRLVRGDVSDFKQSDEKRQKLFNSVLNLSDESLNFLEKLVTVTKELEKQSSNETKEKNDVPE